MATLKEYFDHRRGDNAKGVAGKNAAVKRRIVARLAAKGETSLAELAKELEISIPTITKLVGELVSEDILTDNGKVETAGGRRPNVFGLAGSGSGVNFLGVEIDRHHTSLVITDLRNEIVARSTIAHSADDIDALLKAVAAEARRLADQARIRRDGITGAGVCVPGRVDHVSGMSYGWFTGGEVALRKAAETHFKLPVAIDNNVRARCKAERALTDAATANDMVYVDLGHNMAAAIVVGGALYYGHSGFAGEFAGEPMFGEGTDMDIIMNAAQLREEAAIELVEQAAVKAGRNIAMLLGVLNPELVVVGGTLARAGDYLMLPLQAVVNKHAQNQLYRDTCFRLAQAGANAGAVGAAMTVKSKIVGS